MADEISQVVEMEYKGIYYLIKGTRETMSLLIRGTRAFADYRNKKKLEAPGESDWNKILKVSQGMPNVIEMPKEMFEKNIMRPDGTMTSVFEEYCAENKLRYCMLPDMNPYDDYVPVGVPAQDSAFHQEQVKAVLQKRAKLEEDKAADYEKRVEEARGKLESASTPEEKEAAEKELAELLHAKEENETRLKETRAKEEKGGLITFEEYLKQGLGTSFEKDPEAALQSGGITNEYLPRECMYPIRDIGMTPDSKEIYYTQTTADHHMSTIRRCFETDEKGLAYSTYYVTDAKEPGKLHVFSDENMTRENFSKLLPQMFSDAGMILDQPVVPIGTADRLQEYVVEMERNFKRAPGEGEALSYVRDAQEGIPSKTSLTDTSAMGQTEMISEQSQPDISEKIKEQIMDEKLRRAFDLSQMIQMQVSEENIVIDGERGLSLITDAGLIHGISISVDENRNGAMSVMLDPQEFYAVDRPDGKKDKLLGQEIGDILEQEQLRNPARGSAYRLGDRYASEAESLSGRTQNVSVGKGTAIDHATMANVERGHAPSSNGGRHSR